MKGQKITNKELRNIGISHPDALIDIGKLAKKILKSRAIEKSGLLKFIHNVFTDSSYGNFESKELLELFELINSQRSKIPITLQNKSLGTQVNLNQNALPFKIYGKDYIELGALTQMETAMRLPISQTGALMPDAHEGYGLPIGGVLATNENIVIPYAVGVDIACRMCMSIFPVPSNQLEKLRFKLRDLLGKNTIFGVGSKNKNHVDSTIFDRSEWKSTQFIRQHSDLAFSQLGTSGAGNHFAEWGILKVLHHIPEVNLKSGEYLAFLTHSGSRGFGNETANYYSKVAMSKVNLPKEAKHLAWLDLSTQEGQEYWIAMNLAGEYASANHSEIHKKISKDLGETPLAIIENHHNFAWKEKLPSGKMAIIHRKGATPAGKGVIGIIPGSMTHSGFIIRGKGEPNSLNSASHGAGRSMSRSQALKKYTKSDLEKITNDYGIDLIGGDIDEIPMAYKDIHKVMNLQKDLVEVIATFQPKIVRMADAERRRR
jgi:tRNA-splicing ligase RtcB (3'-phosphate/5'-hydroxy nucleic acid ligase)